jgi:hypothetical protein
MFGLKSLINQTRMQFSAFRVDCRLPVLNKVVKYAWPVNRPEPHNDHASSVANRAGRFNLVRFIYPETS